ncbi:MAG: hypothetical protein JRI79_01120 [Deltaproteobacteria bacterium]|nr:hypothetical protein [Deltaproteobacteria bacterium]MBW1976558.1 hypothetical protein [Deltaproteobacteria bacterium]MBW2044938.1 hypothetical protein [Deltaproteobacteria bacterium]MBW2298738.1 hypothetical protein [Deltaproteobacteria bacterium]
MKRIKQYGAKEESRGFTRPAFMEGLPAAFMAGLPASMQGLRAQAGNAANEALMVDQGLGFILD